MAGSHNNDPLDAAFPGSATHPGRSAGWPENLVDEVEASTINPGVVEVLEGLSYFAALTLGTQFAPPLRQPPAVQALGGIGRVNGVARMQYVGAPADLASLFGMLGDIAVGGFGGVYQLRYTSGIAEDGVTLINRSSAAWSSGLSSVTPGLIVTADSGKYYICTQIDPPAATGTCGVTGPSGTGVQPLDGDVQWVYAGAAAPQWELVGRSNMGVAYGFAALNSSAKLATSFLQTNVANGVAGLNGSAQLPMTTGTLTPESGWTATGVAVQKDMSGIVHLRGNLTSASGPEFAATLSSGYRPFVDSKFPAWIDGTNATLVVGIEASTGKLSIVAANGDVVYLDGISFPTT